MATSHDKGRTRCIIDISTTQKIEIQTLHTVPFRRFKKEIDSEDAKKVLKDIARKLISDKRGIIQGDFNIDVESLKAIYTQLFEAGFNEVPHNEPTTPRGHHYDHILYRDISCIDSVIDARVKTDHFPIISSFKVDV
jgi:endonuclease/exonuclease/phosphatase (EEP) superfamily protein YafD